jgi:nanoRNase/pAp phosphatase (c-di-AMP/oligoRNAs hydrolase)
VPSKNIRNGFIFKNTTQTFFVPVFAFATLGIIFSRKMMPTWKQFKTADTVIVTHGNCVDGYLSGHILKKALGTDKVLRLFHDKPFDYSQLGTSPVIMVDCSPSTQEEFDIFLNRDLALIIDHHLNETTRNWKKLAPLNVILPDVNKDSGAALAWMFSHPGEYFPLVVELVSIRDRFAFQEMEGSIDMTTVLHLTLKFSDNTQDKIDKLLSHTEAEDVAWKKYLLSNAGEVLRTKNKLVSMLVEKQTSVLVELDGKNYNVSLINFNHSLASDIGKQILDSRDTCDFCVIYTHNRENGTTRHSVRSSVKKTHINSAVVSKLLSHDGRGNGHPQAAGFTRVEPPMLVKNSTHLFTWFLGDPLSVPSPSPVPNQVDYVENTWADFDEWVASLRGQMEIMEVEEEMKAVAHTKTDTTYNGETGILINTALEFSTQVFKQAVKLFPEAKFVVVYEHIPAHNKIHVRALVSPSEYKTSVYSAYDWNTDICKW